MTKSTRLFLLVLAQFSLSSVSYGQLLTASTEAGVYQGMKSEVVPSVSQYMGIQFAAPPVRELRWRPPVEAIPFAGVRMADKAGPACWQVQGTDASLYSRGNLHRSEDCLYLNVYSGATTRDESLPVMVWFHGGSNTGGHGAAKIFDGSNLAARGAVIITANYRLGALGFLAHPALTSESENHSSGNYGLLDQIATLKWVENNIAEFGGDPDRVTIFGQSAGGTDVCLLMSSPLAEGLIDGVIGQSPGCIKLERTLEGSDSGHSLGVAYAETLGVSGEDAAAAQELRNVDAQTAISTPGVGGATIIDGWVIPERPYDAMKSSNRNRIPVMVGAMADEYAGLRQLNPKISMEELDAYIDENFGSSSEKIRELYDSQDSQSANVTLNEILSDNSFLLASRMWARLVSERGDNAYLYYFTRPTPVFRLYQHEIPDVNNDGGGRTLGAYHSGELAYVFNNTELLGIGWDQADNDLSDLIADYWISFAKNGNPNADGLPNWPAYDPLRDNVQLLDTNSQSVTHPKSEQLEFLESLYLENRLN